MRGWIALSMYYLSYTPLWIAVIFVDFKSIVYDKNNIYTEIISIWVLSILLFISAVIVQYYIRNVKNNNYEIYEIVSATKPKNIAIEHFLACILPMFAFDFTLWHSVIIFLIFYLSLCFLCIKHNYFSPNIILEICNYDVYECRLRNVDGINMEKLVISNQNIKLQKDIYLKWVNNDYLIEVKEK